MQSVHERAAKDKQDQDVVLMQCLQNAMTVLSLDIYHQFGHFVNVCQTVNLLPHERLEKVGGLLAYMDEMAASSADHTKCPHGNRQWPHFHWGNKSSQ